MTDWWGGYVGARFGTGPGQFTCWSLVRDVYDRHLGVSLPHYGDLSASYVAATERFRAGEVEALRSARAEVVTALHKGQGSADWHPVDKADLKPFDVVLMEIGKIRSFPGHVGLVVDPLRVLHIESLPGAVVVPLGHISVAHRIIGFRRHVSQT